MALDFLPEVAEYADRIKASFDRQEAMRTLGISLASVDPGRVELAMPFSNHLTQQHGFVHAGVISSGIDTACGFAALSLMPDGAAVLTAEFKVSLMRPGNGDHFVFVGQVIKPGRTLMFCEGEAIAIKSGVKTVIAKMSATMMVVTGREKLSG